MRTQEVNYRQPSLAGTSKSRFSHLKLLIAWPIYYTSHILTENLIPEDQCHVVECGLDHIIPFCEWFLIPYVVWYFLVVGALGFFALRDVDGFKKLQTYIIITQVGATLVYILHPNCQLLRPEFGPGGIERDNILIDGIRKLYSVDTNTGVFPSLHCAFSIAIASISARSKAVKPVWKWVLAITALLICLSTAFIKQHSILDFFGAIVLCLVAEVLVFFVFFPKKKA
ncbi:MAG: phosphatase PAP2 family protein [Ruminococcaceae bacterium]|nr:phosphatase PAP2 family protein [Oscillospiraceae bacterium]